MKSQASENLNTRGTDGGNCQVCQALLVHLGRFFEMLETVRRSSASDWLTVEEIAHELKISKSIVYRLIRNGELEAVDVAEKNGEVAKKGHYRVKRSNLCQYLERKKVKPPQEGFIRPCHLRHFPEVKNHLGL